LLKYIEYLGNVGGSRMISLYSDGDGDFRPKFIFNDKLKCKEKPIKDENGNRTYDAR
jgi:hypothetical protein